MKKTRKGVLTPKRSGWFTVITAISVIGTMMAGILTTYLSGPVNGSGGWIQASAGLISFALIYVTSDIISEIYGYRASRLVAFINMGASILLTILMALAWGFSTFIADFNNLAVNTAPFGEPATYESVGLMQFMAQKFFGVGEGNIPAAGPIILLWGWVVAMLGDWVNDLVFKHMKQRDGNGSFFKRSFLSSVVGQLIDVIVFVPVLVAFAITPFAWQNGSFLLTVGIMAVWQLVFKLGVEIIVYPVALLLKKQMHFIEGDESYETSSSNHILG
ncbi:MAG: VUT family protein [Bacteroidia bacterium]|nr:VUT family protein [Bacteroidia bacterium]